jgi:hypothetical protein
MFSDTMPPVEQRVSWLLQHARGNIGLPLGPESGLIALDIDTDDPKVLFALDQVMPKSPWRRIGKKGMVLVFKYNGERTFRVKGAGGDTICELLSKGTQIVLPPSIHPDTRLPYTANVDLLDVRDSVPSLPEDIEAIIRGALTDAGVKVNASGRAKAATFVPAGARDNALVSMAGILSRGIVRGERTLFECLDEVRTWVENFTEHVVGDDVSVEKGQSKLVEFLIRDVTGGRSLPTGWDAGLTEDDKESLGLSFTADDERWPRDKILAYLTCEFERFVSPDTPGWLQAIEVALSKIALNPDLNAIEEDQIVRFIASQSNISLVPLRKRVAELRKGDMNGETHAEIGEAVIEELRKFGEMRFDGGQFWRWKGANWDVITPANLMKVIAEDFGQYPAARRYSDHKGIKDTIAVLVGKPLSQGGVRGLNFANGFLTEDFELVPHRPEQGSTYVLPYCYRPESVDQMPMFRQLLQDCWGEDSDFEEKMAALQEAVGATLCGIAPRYQRVFGLLGQPESGKSRIISVMQGLLPPNVRCAIPPHDWDDRFLPAEMFGKLLNHCGELSESRQISGDIFKTIVEGGEITAQYKNQQPFKFQPTCAHWFAGNHPPKTRDTSDGFNRRWLFLTFDRRIPAAKQIRDIDTLILDSEKEAIAAWAVEGAIRLIKNQHYTLPASHQAAANEVANSNNSVRYFLQASPKLLIGRDKHKGLSSLTTSATKLHEIYWSFIIFAGGAQRVGLKQFTPMMRQLATEFGFEVENKISPNGALEPIFRYLTVAG